MKFEDLKIGDEVTYMHRIMDRWLTWDWYEVTGVIYDRNNECTFLVRTPKGTSEYLRIKDDIIEVK